MKWTTPNLIRQFGIEELLTLSTVELSPVTLSNVKLSTVSFGSEW